MCRSVCRWHTQTKVDLLTSRVLRPQYLFQVRVVQFAWHTSVAMCIPFFATDALITLSLPYICYALVAVYFGGLVAFRLSNRMVYKQLLSYGRTMMVRKPISLLGVSIWVLFQVLLSLTFAASIQYWALVFPNVADHTVTWWELHLTIPLPMLLEFVMNHLDPQPVHVCFVALFAGLYTGFVVLYYHWTTVWLYDYFNSELAPLWGLLGVVVVCVLHLIFCQLARSKPRTKGSEAALLKQPLGSTDKNALSDSPAASTMSDQASPSPQEIEMESCSGCI